MELLDISQIFGTIHGIAELQILILALGIPVLAGYKYWVSWFSEGLAKKIILIGFAITLFFTFLNFGKTNDLLKEVEKAKIIQEYSPK